MVADNNPLLGLKSAIDRRDHAADAARPEPGDQPSRGAVGLHAGRSHPERRRANRGSITPGKWADLAVLSGDPLTTPPDDLLGLVVEQTYAGRPAGL